MSFELTLIDRHLTNLKSLFVSPRQPSLKVISTFTISPSLKILSEGIPWQPHDLSVQHDFGNLYKK